MDPHSVKLYRQAGLHERYNIAHDNIGSTKVINCIAIGVLTGAGVSSIDHLHVLLRIRIQHLLDSAPLLSCHVDGKRSTSPRFARAPERIDAQDVLGPVQFVDSESDLEPASLATSVQLKPDRPIEIENAPLWRVQLFRASDGSQFAVVLHVHHVIADGRAMLEMMRVLLAAYEAPLPADLVLAGNQELKTSHYGSDPLPPISEDINPYHKISILRAAQLVLTEVSATIANKTLPRWLWNALAIWPERICPSPLCTPQPAFLFLDLAPTETGGKVVQGLKVAAKKMSLSGINALIHTAFLIAVFALHKTRKQECPKDNSINLRTDTPVSIRNPDVCGLVSGNFVLQSSWSAVLNGEETVEKLAQEYQATIMSEEGKMRAGRTFSLLPYIFPAWREARHQRTAQDPTQWEPFIRSREVSKSPYRSSFELSNLGPLKGKVLDGINQLFWVQPAHAVSHAVNVNVMGWQEASEAPRLTATMSFYRHSFCTPEEERLLQRLFEESLWLLSCGTIGPKVSLEVASEKALDASSNLRVNLPIRD